VIVCSWNGRLCLFVCPRSHAANSLIAICRRSAADRVPTSRSGIRRPTEATATRPARDATGCWLAAGSSGACPKRPGRQIKRMTPWCSPYRRLGKLQRLLSGEAMAIAPQCLTGASR
jgi:hypothetical protein